LAVECDGSKGSTQFLKSFKSSGSSASLHSYSQIIFSDIIFGAKIKNSLKKYLVTIFACATKRTEVLSTLFSNLRFSTEHFAAII
jgi:hypothetical protein